MESIPKGSAFLLLAQWKNWLTHEKQYSGHTLRAYEGDMLCFFGFLTGHFAQNITPKILEELTTKDIRSWLAYRHGEGLAFKSTARALSTVRSFFNYLEKQEILVNHAAHNAQTPKIPKSIPKALSREDAVDATESIEVMANEGWAGKRDVAILTLIYGCGLRISEALSIKYDQIPLDESLRVIGKGNKERNPGSTNGSIRC